MLNGTPGKKILQIIKASIIWVRITRLYDLGTYTKMIHRGSYLGPYSLALGKGVLELSRMGAAYIRCPYLEFHVSRALSQEPALLQSQRIRFLPIT